MKYYIFKDKEEADSIIAKIDARKNYKGTTKTFAIAEELSDGRFGIVCNEQTTKEFGDKYIEDIRMEKIENFENNKQSSVA